MMNDDSLAIDSILNKCSQALRKSGSLSPRLDCELLLANVLSCARLELYKNKKKFISIEEKALFDELFFRRQKKEPIAYLLGHKEFMGLSFLVSPDVLVPRPDTEILVEIVGEFLTDGRHCSKQILDVGTGSGCIAISLAQQYTSHKFTAWDISVKALNIAKQNACHLLSNNQQSILFEQVDMLDEQSWLNQRQRYHVIVSNPPYIGLHERADLAEDLRYEPQSALFAENGGLEFYVMFAKYAKHYLYDGGKLFLEVSPHLSQQICDILGQYAWKQVRVTKDYSGRERVISCEK